MHDKLLKVRTLGDRDAETHGERTVILTGIAQHARPEELAAALANYGAITSIEVPTIDKYVEAQLEERGLKRDPYTKQREAKREAEYRLAQQLLAEQESFDRDLEQILAQRHGDKGAKDIIETQKGQPDLGARFTKFDMLDGERYQAFTRMLRKL